MLPSGWKLTRLDEFASVARGRFSVRPRNDPRYFGGQIPFVQIGDIVDADIYVRSYSKTLNDMGVAVSKVFPVDTILLSIIGTIGATALTRFPVACPDHVVGIQPDPARVDVLWLKYALDAQQKTLHGLAGQSAQKTLNLQALGPLEIPVPPREEQERIAEILSTWDHALAVTEKLLANRRRQKRVLTHQLLSGKRRLHKFTQSARRVTTRFGSVPADWPHVPIEDVADEVSIKNEDTKPLPVLSCTKHAGLVDSASYFRKRVHSENTSAYKVVERGCFAYATNHIDEGSIGCQTLYDSALISPMYTVFKVSERLDDSFLYKVLKTEHYRQIFAANTNASVDRRGSLRWRDFEKIEIPVPSIEEQKAISSVINIAELEIKNLERQLAALRKEKKGLMVQLLMGKRRIRLPEPPEQAAA
jgi:type I restriction enzyme, S subunit